MSMTGSVITEGEGRVKKYYSPNNPPFRGCCGPGKAAGVRDAKKTPTLRTTLGKCSPRQSPPTLRWTHSATNFSPHGSESHELRTSLDEAKKWAHLQEQDLREIQQKRLHHARPPAPCSAPTGQGIAEPGTSYCKGDCDIILLFPHVIAPIAENV